MVKLLIVDDEQEIREGIKFSVDWEKNGIAVIGEASNGIEALSIINHTFPDIVLVDIRMPEMNGLQLMEVLSTAHPYIKPIILSGYEDFEYARKGLKYGAVDYLLKPCRPNEILNSVLSAKNYVETEINRRNALLKYESDHKEFLPVIKNKYLHTLVSQCCPDESMLKKLEFLNLNINSTDLMLAVIRYDTTENSSTNMNIEDSERIKSSLSGLAKDIIGKGFRCECFESNDDIIAIINTNKDEASLLPLLDEVKSAVQNKMNTAVSIGISNPCSHITEIHEAYKQALHAVEFKFFYGENSTISFNRIKNQYNNNKAYPINLEKQLLNCIKAGDEASAIKKVNLFFDVLTEADNNKSFIIKSYHALLFTLYQLCLENNISVDEIFEQLEGSDNLYCLSTIKRLRQNVAELVISTSRKMKNTKVNNRLIDNTLKFINDNYNRNLSLEEVANKAYITPSYLSLLFKQVLGINFVDYLNKIRMNKACELLRDPKLKSYEIAYLVGYNDDKYFSQIFKKHIGLTPTQYRDSLI